MPTSANLHYYRNSLRAGLIEAVHDMRRAETGDPTKADAEMLSLAEDIVRRAKELQAHAESNGL